MTQISASHKPKIKKPLLLSLTLCKLYLYFVTFIYMAFSLNRAQIIGNLTRDPEVRVAGGQKVATFGVATTLSWKDATGTRKEKTEFHNIVAWRKLAEICELYLKKGTKVYIEGRMQTRDWEGEDGVKRYKTEILADNMIMLDKKGQSSSGLQGVPAETAQEAQSGNFAPSSEVRQQKNVKKIQKTQEAAENQSEEEEVSIDDLPF